MQVITYLNYILHTAKLLGQNKGICFEAQGYADATKHPQFNNVVLLPNEVYEFFTEFKFQVIDKNNKWEDEIFSNQNPFFNVSGLTSSEANYVCERIKERLKPIQDLVSSIETHTSSIDGEPLVYFHKGRWYRWQTQWNRFIICHFSLFAYGYQRKRKPFRNSK